MNALSTLQYRLSIFPSQYRWTVPCFKKEKKKPEQKKGRKNGRAKMRIVWKKSIARIHVKVKIRLLFRVAKSKKRSKA